MDDVREAIKKLGGIHDAILSKLTWDAELRILTMEVDDLYANFEGFEGWPQERVKTEFKFVGVTQLRLDDLDFTECGLMIYDWDFPAEGTSEIGFSPGGRLTIKAEKIQCADGFQFQFAPDA